MKVVLKRIEDVVVASLLIVITSPIMFIAAIILKITSSGPIIYKQLRYGINYSKIEVWKFSTMRVAKQNSICSYRTLKNDHRVTKFGKFLRKTSIDEFPQFFNVIRGTMSIVGPRPHALEMFDDYSKKCELSPQRLKVKPGITGLSQIQAPRVLDSNEKIKNIIKLDIDYINKQSLFLDLKIIFISTLIFLRLYPGHDEVY